MAKRVFCVFVKNGGRETKNEAWLFGSNFSKTVIHNGYGIITTPVTDTAVLRLRASRKHSPPEVWTHAMEAPEACTSEWVKSMCGVVPLDVFNPTHFGNVVQIFARVPTNRVEEFLSRSGRAGMFSSSTDEKVRLASRVDWLSPDTGLDNALKRANVEQSCSGVIVNKHGLGLRVPKGVATEVASPIMGPEAALRMEQELLRFREFQFGSVRAVFRRWFGSGSGSARLCAPGVRGPPVAGLCEFCTPPRRWCIRMRMD